MAPQVCDCNALLASTVEVIETAFIVTGITESKAMYSPTPLDSATYIVSVHTRPERSESFTGAIREIPPSIEVRKA